MNIQVSGKELKKKWKDDSTISEIGVWKNE